MNATEVMNELGLSREVPDWRDAIRLLLEKQLTQDQAWGVVHSAALRADERFKRVMTKSELNRNFVITKPTFYLAPFVAIDWRQLGVLFGCWAEDGDPSSLLRDFFRLMGQLADEYEAELIDDRAAGHYPMSRFEIHGKSFFTISGPDESFLNAEAGTSTR